MGRPMGRPTGRRLTPKAMGGLSLLLLAMSLLAGSGMGAYELGAGQMLQALWRAAQGLAPAGAPDLVFMNIRLPRLLLGALAGAGLGLSGALMQGLFRNPLADPGLIGVSSGAALAVGLGLVIGANLWPTLPRTLGSPVLVALAFGGGLLFTALTCLLAQAEGGTRMGLMLLGGIALNALAGAGLGLMSFLATDEQMRNLQFWLLGSLGGARWSALAWVAPAVLLACGLGQGLARGLNVLALGEGPARLAGVEVESLKRRAIVASALAVGAVTACTGLVGFVGLMAPHGVRLLAGPDHRVVLPASALWGAALVVLADAAARMLVRPAELPLGVLTAFLGAPVFLFMLRRQRGVL
ncbi:MAG: iron ABC transporter permease [Curvibacter sp.]|nr:iron ABC transporter permease [Curvibacter sp.]